MAEGVEVGKEKEERGFLGEGGHSDRGRVDKTRSWDHEEGQKREEGEHVGEQLRPRAASFERERKHFYVGILDDPAKIVHDRYRRRRSRMKAGKVFSERERK